MIYKCCHNYYVKKLPINLRYNDLLNFKCDFNYNGRPWALTKFIRSSTVPLIILYSQFMTLGLAVFCIKILISLKLLINLLALIANTNVPFENCMFSLNNVKTH